MGKKETVIVFSAHSDDFVIGAGGTIAQYVKEGKKVLAIVFSYGEMSHPWLKSHVVKKMRSEETFDAAEVLGCKVMFFDLKEGKFQEDYTIEKKLMRIVEKEKPIKIFTHSHEDPHPDHRSVNTITLNLCEKLEKKPEVYIYSIWNPVSFKTQFPSLYINISKTFSAKLRSLHRFKSQKFQAIYPLMTIIFFRAFRDGIKMRKRFGEHFFRVK
jgi:LmbE family N-acetylglucosaminyl deacetylase